MNLNGDIRFEPNHRQNRGFFGFLSGLEIKQVQGPYSLGPGQVFTPSEQSLGEVFTPAEQSLGQVFTDGS